MPDLTIISERLKNFNDLLPKDRAEVFTQLKQIADISFIKVAESESICPVHQEPVTLPCGLKKCRYWVDQPWTRNCALNFLATQEKENLTVDQVSLLFRKPPERVDAIYKRAFKIVQRHYLKDQVRNRGTPWFQYLQGYCVACQSKLLEEEILDPKLRLDVEHGYCSVDCKFHFPPQYYLVEKFFESDFYRVVEVGGELFNFYYLEEILGFQPNALRYRLEKIRKNGV
jgi:hypothetical protein